MGIKAAAGVSKRQHLRRIKLLQLIIIKTSVINKLLLLLPLVRPASAHNLPFVREGGQIFKGGGLEVAGPSEADRVVSAGQRVTSSIFGHVEAKRWSSPQQQQSQFATAKTGAGSSLESTAFAFSISWKKISRQTTGA